MEEAMETNRLRRKACTWVAWVLAAAGVLEAGMGLCQVAGLCASRHALYLLTGSFYNPGPYSGFLAEGATQSAKGADGFYTISK